MQLDFNTENKSDVRAVTQLAAMTLDNVKYFIDTLLDNFDIDRVPDENLDIIHNILGYPQDKEEDPSFLRKNLKYAIDLYKTKGTVDSIKILFYSLGIDVDIIPLWTPDYTEYVEISPPYIKLTMPAVQYLAQSVDVTVVNPDEQLYTYTSGYQFY